MTPGLALRELKLARTSWAASTVAAAVPSRASLEDGFGALARPDCALTSLKIARQLLGQPRHAQAGRGAARARRARWRRPAPPGPRWARPESPAAARGDARVRRRAHAAAAAVRMRRSARGLGRDAAADDEYMYSKLAGHDDPAAGAAAAASTARRCSASVQKGVLSLKLLGDMLYAGDRTGGRSSCGRSAPAADQHQCKDAGGAPRRRRMLQYGGGDRPALNEWRRRQGGRLPVPAGRQPAAGQDLRRATSVYRGRSSSTVAEGARAGGRPSRR